MTNAPKLPKGYEVLRDSDGDWVLLGPENVTIFSVPGEPVLLLHASNEIEAAQEASDYLAAIPAEYADQ